MYDPGYAGEPEDYFVDGKFVPKLLADDIMQMAGFRSLYDTGEVYIDTNDVWRPNGEEYIRKWVRKILRDKAKTHYENEVVEHIRSVSYTHRSEIGWPEGKIHVRNGLLDLETKELEPRTQATFSITMIPWDYDPDAYCGEVLDFLENTLRSGDVQVIAQLIGYCLLPDYPIHKAFMFVGDGANGKSTMIELIRSFLGKENTSSVGLQALTHRRFARADLFGKLANLHADIPDQGLRRTGFFKMLTGQDIIRAEKKYKSSFQFRNHAKLIFSANKVPEVHDDTSAFFRRWRLIDFPYKFTGSDADPNITDKLVTEEQMSGLLNVALDALKGLLENNQFYRSKGTEEIREDYRRRSNPVGAFVMDRIEKDPQSTVTKKGVYERYREYCMERELPVEDPSVFGRKLKKEVEVSDTRKKIDGRQQTCYRGIRFRD